MIAFNIYLQGFITINILTQAGLKMLRRSIIIWLKLNFKSFYLLPEHQSEDIMLTGWLILVYPSSHDEED